eukprot:5037660-Prymnesium_polylepis.2
MTHTPLSSGSTNTNRHCRALRRRVREVCSPTSEFHSPTYKVPPEMLSARTALAVEYSCARGAGVCRLRNRGTRIGSLNSASNLRLDTRLGRKPRWLGLHLRAATLVLGEEGMLPRLGQLRERHSADLTEGLATVGTCCRLVETIDPARARRVRLLAAARIEAARRLRRLHNFAEHFGVAGARDNLVHGGDAPRAAIAAVARRVAITHVLRRIPVGRHLGFVELTEDCRRVAHRFALEQPAAAMVEVAELVEQVRPANSLVAWHVVPRVSTCRAVTEVRARRAFVPAPVSPVDADVTLGVAGVAIVDRERELVDIEIAAGLRIAALMARRLAVRTAERVDDHLEEVEEEIARRVACIHVVGNGASRGWVDMVHRDVPCVRWVDAGRRQG